MASVLRTTLTSSRGHETVAYDSRTRGELRIITEA